MRVIPTVAAFAALVLAACGGDGSERVVASVSPGQSGRGPVVSVQVIGPGNLELGKSATFYAIAFTADGDSTFTSDVTWSTSDAAVLRVTGNGGSAEVEAVADGAADVLASIQGVTGSRTVHIGPIVVGPLASIELIPPNQVIVYGDSGLGAIEAILRDAAGNLILDMSVTWSVSDPTVLAFRSEQATFALLEALKPGTATVTAEAEGKSGSASVTVE